jgi:hypothetical protein
LPLGAIEDRGAFGRVAIGRSCPRPPADAFPPCRRSRAGNAHRPRLGGAAVARQRASGDTLGQPTELRFALRLVVRSRARCVGPTSAFSRLRTSTRAS